MKAPPIELFPAPLTPARTKMTAVTPCRATPRYSPHAPSPRESHRRFHAAYRRHLESRAAPVRDRSLPEGVAMDRSPAPPPADSHNARLRSPPLRVGCNSSRSHLSPAPLLRSPA